MMKHYQVLARKYRPQTFFDVVGQCPTVTTLKNAIKMGRTAHAYLFCGSRGTGKTTLARLFAKALNCVALTDAYEPCNACPSCQEIAAGLAIDVLEIDGASHRGIEDIRQINETVAFAPTGKRYKIYLIDEVHMLTKEAFNALLKTLEEPPPLVKFFFCTTEPHKLPATILSRCQRFNLNRISIEELETRLAHIAAYESIKIDQEALTIIATRAEGSLRDALSLFDQMIAFEKETITTQTALALLGLPSKEIFFSLDRAGAQNNLMAAFQMVGDLFASGINLCYFLEELVSHFRTLLLVKCGITTTEKSYQESASYYRLEQLIQILGFLLEAERNIKSAPSERVAVEMLLLKIIQSHKQLSLETLVDRLLALEKQLSFSEDITPRPEELPQKKIVNTVKSKPGSLIQVDQQLPKTIDTGDKIELSSLEMTRTLSSIQETKEAPVLSIQEQSRFDTIMRFAAKELNASLKKE